MKRLIVLLACLVLVSAACKKSSEPAATPEPAQEPAAAAPASGPSDAAPPAEPKTIEFNDEMVQKYIEWQKESLALWQQYAVESRKNLESAKGDTAKTLNQMSLAEKYGKEVEAKLEAKRQSLGLGREEFDQLKDAAQMLATGRALYNQMGGDAQLAKMEAESKAQLAKMAPEQRAAAEASLAEYTKGLRDVRDGIEIRKKYGDKNADVMLKHADALAKLYWDAVKELSDKK